MLNLNVFLKAALVLALSGSGTAYGADVMVLNADDFVGISFWLATAIMLASTVFFFIERGDVAVKWRTSLTVAGLVTGIAFWHYLYMRGIWVATGDSPTVYRYIDWLITVPLQIVEFYLILAAVTAVRTGLFWQLLIASVVMLLGGYGGETGVLSPAIGFVIGVIFFAGELSYLVNAPDSSDSMGGVGDYTIDSTLFVDDFADDSENVIDIFNLVNNVVPIPDTPIVDVLLPDPVIAAHLSEPNP